MGWFDWLRSAPAPEINHPVFGRLRAVRQSAAGAWLWEVVEPSPVGVSDPFVHIDADEEGPNSTHEAQWVRIRAQLDSLTQAAVPLISAALAGWKEVPFDPERPWGELEWIGAHLHGAAPGGDFSLIYSCRHWPDAMITIDFENGKPIGSRLDD